jgi:hypothetical protein
MGATLRNWWRNATDALDLMWTEPLSWLIIAGACLWIVLEYRRVQRLRLLRTLAIAGLGVWLVAAFAITIYPIDLEAPAAYRFEVKSIVPLWGTIEAIADSDGFIMDEAEWRRRRQEIADEQGVPVDQINYSRRVYGPGLSAVLKDPIGNMVLFVPLGFLVALGWPRCGPRCGRCWRGCRERWNRTIPTVVRARQPRHRDDVIFNSVGAVIGWQAWRITAYVDREAPANAR